MKRPRILVVEDQAIVARDIASRLTRLGYEPVGRTDRAEEAIVLAAELRPDLVLMDISLAGEMDGIAAAREIRRHHPIPVVFLTAHADDATMDGALLTDPFGYIIKPFQDRELRSAIELVICRGRMEQALRVSEERYHRLFDTSPDALFLVGPDGRFLDANSVAVRRYGYSLDELKAMTPAGLSEEGMQDEAAARVAEALQAGTAFEWRHRTKDGRVFPVEIVTQPILVDGQRCSFADARDITARKRAEAALLEREEQLRSIASSIPGAIYQFVRRQDGSIAIPFMSEGARVLFDRPLEELQDPSRLFDDVHPEDVPGLWASIAVSAKDLTPWSAEFRLVPKTAPQRWLRGASNPRRLPDGGVCWNGVLLDITEQRKAEERLRASEALLRQTQQLSHVGGWEWDPSRQSMVWTDETYRLHDLNPDDISAGPDVRIARSLECYDESDRPTVLATFRKCVEEGEPYDLEFPFTTFQGRRLWVRTSAQAVTKDGKVERVVGLIMDITEQRRLESQLLRAQRLESVGRLASGLAHDLNNILLPVLLAPPYLRTVVNDRAALEVLDTIEVSVKRGADIIKQLLTFGCGSDARRGPMCLCRTVGDAMRVLAETLPRSIDLRCELPPGVRMVNANSTQLHQVIMNLCLNARDAMAGFGRLILRVEEMTLTASEAAAIPDASPGRFHVLCVIDTGCGILPENTGKIFEPFFTTKEFGEASGLGLSTALGIVRGHKGFIEVRSHVGKGTEMRVCLPELPNP